MWLEYIRERLPHKSVIERDGGFAIFYEFEAEDAMYIEDIYVKRELRKSNLATNIMEEIIIEAKKCGFKYILGSNDPTTAGSTSSMKAMLARGFEVYKVDNGMIFLRKEIE